MPSAPSAIELRTLILAPVGRDGPLTEELLERAHLRVTCAGPSARCATASVSVLAPC